MKRLSNVLPRLIYVIPVALTLALLACGGQLAVEVTREVEDTRKVEVTPTIEAPATPSPAPTPTAVKAATVAPEPEEEQQPPLEIPDRGYNSVGNPDAPVTLFDFSDFT